jgi:hypothetical protein
LPAPPLELAWGPRLVFEDPDLSGFARAVARAGGFDLLYRPELSSRPLRARRASLASRPLRLEVAARVADLAPGSSVAIVADGNRLALCHALSVGSPIQFSAFDGAYEAAHVDRRLYDKGVACDGLAFEGELGLVAVSKDPPDGACCVRSSLAEISATGALLGAEQLAFPGDPGSISRRVALTAHAGRFVWAGYVNNTAALRVAFAGGAVPERVVDVPGEIDGDTRPHVTGWPFTRGASVSWRETPQRSRIVAVDDDGTRHLDAVIEGPNGELVSRPELAPTPDGLVAAYTLCPSHFAEPGELWIELFGRDGGRRGEGIRLDIDCYAPVASAAALENMVLVLWPRDELVTQNGFSGLRPTGFFGALVRTSAEQ